MIPNSNSSMQRLFRQILVYFYFNISRSTVEIKKERKFQKRNLFPQYTCGSSIHVKVANHGNEIWN